MHNGPDWMEKAKRFLLLLGLVISTAAQAIGLYRLLVH